MVEIIVGTFISKSPYMRSIKVSYKSLISKQQKIMDFFTGVDIWDDIINFIPLRKGDVISFMADEHNIKKIYYIKLKFGKRYNV